MYSAYKLNKRGDKIYNCAAVCHGGEVIALAFKKELTNEESRFFTPGDEAGCVINCGDYNISVTIGGDRTGNADVSLCLGAVPELVGAYDSAQKEAKLRSSAYKLNKQGDNIQP